MLERFLNPDFWDSQAAIVMSASWLVLALLLIAVLLGWLLRGTVSRRQAKRLKAQLWARDERLQLAQQIEEDVAEKLAIAKAEAEQLRKQVALCTSVEAGFVAIRSLVASTVTALDTANTYSNVLRDTLSPPST